MLEQLEARRLLAITATPGNIDPSFGVGGVSTINAHNMDSAMEVIVQPDGKIVVAGWTGEPPTNTLSYFSNSITLVRLNADGSLDNTFGVGGKARFVAMARSMGEPLPLELMEDGTLLVGGDRLRMVSATGQLLQTLGDDRVDAIGVDDDGKIVTMTNIFRFNRYNADGTPDTTFSEDGFVSLREGFDVAASGWAESRDLRVQSDGKIVAIGSISDGNSGYEVVVTRLSADGELDSSFGTGGKFFYEGPPEQDIEGWTVEITPDGEILAIGGGGSIITFLRLIANGTPDVTFGGDGIVTADAGSAGTISYDARLDDEGKIYLAVNNGMTIRRFEENGTADGIFTVTAGEGVRREFQSAHGVALQNDGKIIGVGHVQLGEEPFNEEPFEAASDYYVFRLLPTGDDTTPPVEPPTQPDVELLSNGFLVVNNLTSGDDLITLSIVDGQVQLNRNGTITTYPLADVNSFGVDAGEGTNSITVSIDISVTISTGDGDDTITTAGGDDLVFSGNGADSIATGDGRDGIVTGGVAGTETGAIIDSGAGNDRIGCGFATTITAGDGDDIVTATIVNEILGGDGADHITAIGFALRIDAGAGNDIVRCSSDAANPALIFGGDGRDLISTGWGRDSIYGGAGSDKIHAGDGSDLLSGGGGHDELFGQGGHDRIYAGAANDRLEGQGGNDRLIGGAGEDILQGGNRDDLLIASGDDSIDVVFGGAGTDSCESDEHDVLTSIEVVA